MDRLNSASERVFGAKRAHRKRMAKLPIHEKIRILVRMQKMAAPILKDRGKDVRVWRIGERVRDE